MRRMLMLVTIMAVMAAMVAASAIPGLAQEEGLDEEDWGQYWEPDQYQTQEDGGSDPRQYDNCDINEPDEPGGHTGYTDDCL